MGRLARIVIPGVGHHVTQRGNRRADVFFNSADRLYYLRMLGQYAGKHGLTFWAWCLMPNHVHLVAVPSREQSLSLALRDAHTAYASAINRRMRLSGHLWQGRFYSCVLDEPHLFAAVRYVERNPVRAGLVKRAEDWPWSSAAAHCGLKKDTLLADFPLADSVGDWKAWLQDEQDLDVAEIRRRTRTGRPCGSETFIKDIEARTGRTLLPGKPGPKPKKRNVNHDANILFGSLSP